MTITTDIVGADQDLDFAQYHDYSPSLYLQYLLPSNS